MCTQCFLTELFSQEFGLSCNIKLFCYISKVQNAHIWTFRMMVIMKIWEISLTNQKVSVLKWSPFSFSKELSCEFSDGYGAFCQLLTGACWKFICVMENGTSSYKYSACMEILKHKALITDNCDLDFYCFGFINPMPFETVGIQLSSFVLASASNIRFC